MRIRFRFVNNTGNGWEHDFMIDNVTVKANSVISISELNEASSIQFFPNPVVDQLQMKGLPDGDLQVKLYNTTGKLLHSETVSKDYGQFDFSELKKGIYFLKLMKEDELVTVRKVLKK